MQLGLLINEYRAEFNIEISVVIGSINITRDPIKTILQTLIPTCN